MTFDGKLVKGAPYSGQAVTETVQTLADGNRIVNRSTSDLYRDSEGRTRREESIKVIGALGNSGESPRTIIINDPVAGVNYVLDTKSHTAHKMTPMRFEWKIAPTAPGEKSARARVGALPAGAPPLGGQQTFEIHTYGPGPALAAKEAGTFVFQGGSDKKNVVTESLGRQNIEGVDAEGTRSTITIPEGEIGNERPIVIVSERWYSPDLQTVVLTRHSDPRFGETTYRLTNINRSEPAKALFEVPADYTIQETPKAAGPLHARKPMNDQ